MSTLYRTPRGDSWEPIMVELWTWTGQRLGRVGAYEEMSFMFTDRTADTAELQLYLDQLTAALLPCDGTVLVGARYNGKTHLTTPVTAQAHGLDDDPTVAMITATTAGGWTLLDGQIIPPSLEDPLHLRTSEEYHLTGSLEDVAKRVISIGAARTGHPLLVLPSSGRGPTVDIRGAWETVAEVVQDMLAHSGYRLAMDGWLPGDPQPADWTLLDKPTVIVDLVAYRSQPGLIWTVESGEISDWEVTRKRSTATRLVAGNGAEELENMSAMEVQGRESGSPWDVRESYLKVEDPEPIDEREPDRFLVAENMETQARAELASHAPAMEVSVEVDHSAAWDFGTDLQTPRQFDVGDYAEVVLPVIGPIRQVITDVELRLTATEFTVRPTVSTPDTMNTDIFSLQADTARRVSRIERT